LDLAVPTKIRGLRRKKAARITGQASPTAIAPSTSARNDRSNRAWAKVSVPSPARRSRSTLRQSAGISPPLGIIGRAPSTVMAAAE